MTDRGRAGRIRQTSGCRPVLRHSHVRMGAGQARQRSKAGMGRQDGILHEVGHGTAGDTPVARLTRAVAKRVTRSLYLRGIDADDSLGEAILREAGNIAEATLAGTDTGICLDADLTDTLAGACSSILCDLPTANIMQMLLPDPHLTPLDADLRAIARAGDEGAATAGPYGGEDTELRQVVERHVNDATERWDAMSPHGRALVRIDKAGVRKGLMVGLGFDGYLVAERRMAGLFAPREPYPPTVATGRAETDE